MDDNNDRKAFIRRVIERVLEIIEKALDLI